MIQANSTRKQIQDFINSFNNAVYKEKKRENGKTAVYFFATNFAAQGISNRLNKEVMGIDGFWRVYLD